MLFDIPVDLRKLIWRRARYLSAGEAVERHLRVKHMPTRGPSTTRLVLPLKRAPHKRIRWTKWDTNTGLDYVLSIIEDDKYLTGVVVDEDPPPPGRFWQRLGNSSRWFLAGPCPNDLAARGPPT